MAYIDPTTVINDPLNEGKSGLRDGTQYYWKVEAIDKWGAKTSAAATFSFMTNNTNAPPGIASIHISSAIDFSNLLKRCENNYRRL